MASSNHRQRHMSLTPRDNHSHGCTTHKMKTSTSREDSRKVVTSIEDSRKVVTSIEYSMRKVTITTETTHEHQSVSKGNQISLEQEIVNQKKKTIMDKRRPLVKQEKHEVREKKTVKYINGEKEKKRIPHRHKNGALEASSKIKL